MLLLSLSPATVVTLHAAFQEVHAGRCSLEEDAKLLGWLLLVFQLRAALYFGMLGLFVQSFRGERVDKSLFYWLVAPVRRDVLVFGKFLAASLGGFVLFAAGVITCMALTVLHLGDDGTAYLWQGRGLEQLGTYLGITLLACLGYGAVFLILNHVFKNPVLAAVGFFGWESVSGLLPKALQLLSVTFYLKPLFPVDLPLVGISGLLTAVVDPIPKSWAVLGLLLVSAVAVTTVAMRFRRVELEATD
jgi:ABC-type transport system involved in multi-copper enzyme maturation permease subunit